MNQNSTFLIKKSLEKIQAGNYEGAELYLKQVIKSDKKNSEAFRYLGVIAAFRKDYSTSIQFLDEALRIAPKNYLALTNKGSVLTKIKSFSEATDFFDRAIKIMPTYHEAWSNKGLLSFEIRDYQKALENYETAIKFKNDFLPAWLNKANVLLTLNQEKEAENIYQTLITNFPDYSDARYNYALFLLERKNFIKGWYEYEYRWTSSEFHSKKIISNNRIWNGKDKNKNLLIWPEQGIGDQILYGSMISDVYWESKKLTIALEKKLLPIFSRSFPNITFLDKNDIASDLVIEYDNHLPIASLGNIFRPNIENFKSDYKYLYADANRTSKIKESLSFKKKLRCGIAWRSSNPYVGDEKSIALKDFLQIFNNLNFELINLQHDIDKNEKNLLQENNALINIFDIDLYNDIDGLSSLIEACDLIVTTSSTIAHLTGAIGRKGVVIIPYTVGKFWYWHEYDNVSLWYPSINIFRQKKQGEWEIPIRGVHEYLRNYFG